jgi:hypothetical protein
MTRAKNSRYLLLVCAINLLSISLLSLQNINGQDSIPSRKNLKNSIKLNLTNPMIFGDRCFVVGYERTIGNHQSFSVNLGRFSLPQLFNINTDSIEDLTKDVNSKGFHASGDYRFYLSKENRYNAPHGVYIGPYFTYNSYIRYFDLKASTEAFTGEFNTDISFRVATLGFQLGYQFILWNRVTLDMILFGPGVGAYKVKASLSTNLDPDTESELFQKINEVLQEKIPGYSLAINPGTFEKTGTFNKTGGGFRYVVMLGFRF